MLRIFCILILSYSYNCYSIQYFEFDYPSTKDNISTAILTNFISLPKVFTICSFHKQLHVQDLTVYVMYENSELTKPWFSLSLWDKGNLWANMQEEWYLLGVLPLIKLRQWNNFCTEINLKIKTLRISINGGRVTSMNITNSIKIQKLFMRYIHLSLNHINLNLNANASF